MPASKPLYIAVPDPCAEDWHSMTQESNGRFCSSCQKTVIDFSRLSDTEFYDYFKNLKTIPCGRFHKQQLNTSIVPVKKEKKWWLKLYRPIAAVITFFSIRYNAIATDKKEIPFTLSPVQKESNLIATTEKVIINGTVTDKEGLPLQDAEVRLNEQIVAKTDKNGYYEFELSDTTAKSYILVISYPNLTSTVRSYHPAMLSTSFNVVLEKLTSQGDGNFFMGVPAINSSTFPSENICFKKNVKALDDTMKSKLSEVALWMRNNPGTMIKIVGYPPFETLNKARQNTIKNHLVNIEGISEERILVIIESKANKQMANTLEIVYADKE